MRALVSTVSLLFNNFTFNIYMKVFGAFRVAVKMLLMWNSTMEIDGGKSTVVSASVLEVRNLAVLRVNGLYH